MILNSRIVFYLSAFIIVLGLYSCVDDEEVRLPTDVTVEGREMFNTSFALSEHLNLLVIPFDRFTEKASDTVPLPGCPSVTINSEERRVTLTFNPEVVCPNSTLRRSGGFTLLYTTSLITNEELVLIDYQNYGVVNLRIEGSRLITPQEDTPLGSFKDSMNRLMVFDEFGSSTRVTAAFEHQLAFGSDSTQQVTTTGSGGGRNLAGRSFNFTIEDQKVQYQRCIDEGIFVHSSGLETWTFERTVSAAVTHRMNFGNTGECDRNVSISLSNGETLTINP